MEPTVHLDRRSRYSITVIRQALFELLETKALDEITVVDICRAADVNRGTFYKYYRDVPDLYEKTEDALVEELHGLPESSGSPDPQEHFYLKKVLTMLANNKEFAYIAQNKDFSQRLAQKLLTYYIPQLQQNIEKKCPAALSGDTDLLLEYILGGCIRVISYWLKNGMQIPIDELERTLSAMIAHSLSMYE